MTILSALQVVRDLNAPFDVFIGALEALSMYRDGDYVVDYCSILEQYVYIELSYLDLFYLGFLSV